MQLSVVGSVRAHLGATIGSGSDANRSQPSTRERKSGWAISVITRSTGKLAEQTPLGSLWKGVFPLRSTEAIRQ
jgi:hypothetical protein